MSSFDWVDYIGVAEELADKDDQASWRSAISRAYYAAYMKARRRMESKRKIGADRSLADLASHEEVWLYFSGANGRTNKQIGELGFILRRLRVMADYWDGDSFMTDQSNVKQTIAIARKIIDLLPRV